MFRKSSFTKMFVYSSAWERSADCKHHNHISEVVFDPPLWSNVVQPFIRMQTRMTHKQESSTTLLTQVNSNPCISKSHSCYGNESKIGEQLNLIIFKHEPINNFTDGKVTLTWYGCWLVHLPKLRSFLVLPWNPKQADDYKTRVRFNCPQLRRWVSLLVSLKQCKHLMPRFAGPLNHVICFLAFCRTSLNFSTKVL